MRGIGALVLVGVLFVGACGDDDDSDTVDAAVNTMADAAANQPDAATPDAAIPDAAIPDADPPDAGPPDACVDEDTDTICDVIDNCPGVSNMAQTDTHGVKTRTLSSFGIEALTGTEIGCFLSTVSLPFSFTYFGTAYTTIQILPEGWVYFGSSPSSFSAMVQGVAMVCQNGSDAIPMPLIAAAWTTMSTQACGGAGAARYEVRGTAPDRRMVVSWDAVQAVGGAVTAQLVLHEMGSRIELHTLNQPSLVATRGAQARLGATGSNGRRTHLPGQNGVTFGITNESIEITTDDAPDDVGDDCDNTEDEVATANCGFGY